MQKDYILNEIEKITLSFARLIGLKQDCPPHEFIQLVDSMMQDEFNVKLQNLLDMDNDAFDLFLEEGNFHPDKLEVLAQFLYMHAEPFEPNPETLAVLQKTISIFDVLEQKHHRSSFDDVNKRNAIYKFVQSNYE